MSRPTRISINTAALLHNLNQIKQKAPNQQVIAMVKANAYGCGIESVVKTLTNQVDGFGVACLEEALVIRDLGLTNPCVVLGGVFSQDEFKLVAGKKISCVIHQAYQLQWLLNTPLTQKIKVWIKVDTGMHRLGFPPEEVPHVLTALKACAWVDSTIVLMTHFSCADEWDNPVNFEQIDLFNSICFSTDTVLKSLANSAAIWNFPLSHGDIIRPGISLYGVSPIVKKIGHELGLMPVMSLTSKISAIKQYPNGEKIGYGASWETLRPSTIAIVPVGYGDGYPRHIAANTPVWINGKTAPIVGRVSMDMMTVDITDCPTATVGDDVELWGNKIAIETIALSAGTIAYELLCKIIHRPQYRNVDNM